jgi:hypothetical protein
MAGNVNSPNIKNNKWSINIGKGSEFYRLNRLSVHLPIATRVRPKICPIDHIVVYIFNGQTTSADGLLAKSPRLSIGPHHTKDSVFDIANAPDTLTLCASYESNIPGMNVPL